MADRRIYAGYNRRYDGKMIYIVTMAKDADTGEDTVIWTPTVFSESRLLYHEQTIPAGMGREYGEM